MTEREVGGMWMVVGLGNPGHRHSGNRHNVGAMVVQRLAARRQTSLVPDITGARLAFSAWQPPALMLARPTSFMNESGEQVAALLEKFQAPPQRLLVVHDDLDLPFGEVRLKRGGGDGGHRGLRSITDHLDTQDYARLRIGIGRPPEGTPVIDFVLGDFTGDELAVMLDRSDAAADAVETVASFGWERAMNTVNAPQRPAAPVVFALPPEPPIGTTVRGREFYHRRTDEGGRRQWARGRSADDIASIAWWTWGEVLDDGPVTVQ